LSNFLDRLMPMSAPRGKIFHLDVTYNTLDNDSQPTITTIKESRPVAVIG